MALEMPTEREMIERVVDVLKSKYGIPLSNIKLSPNIPIKSEIVNPDILVFENKDSKEIPLVVVEVKENLHPLHQEELFRYMSSIGSPYGILYDGNSFVFYNQVSVNRSIEIPDMPFEAKGEIPFRKDSLNIPRNLTYKLERIVWIISDSFRREGKYLDPLLIIISLQKILLCKIVDERNQDSDSIFFSTNLPWDPIEHIRKMRLLFEKVKETYPDVFDSNEKLGLTGDIITTAVSELQSYSITKDNLKMLRSAYQKVVYAVLDRMFSRVDLVSAPQPVNDFIIKLLNPGAEQMVIDPYAGFGELLLECLEYVEDEISNSKQSGDIEENTKKYAKEHLFGIVRHSLSSIAKCNMIINGDGHSHIIPSDPFSISYLGWRSKFDIVLTIPPFGWTIGGKSTKSFSDQLMDAGLGHGLYAGRYLEYLFIELGMGLLKPNGKMVIILPEHFLFSRDSFNLRRHLLSNHLVKGIISLPINLFKHTKIKTSMILIEKSEHNAPTDHKIFMAEVISSGGLAPYDPNHLDIIVNKFKEFKEKNKVTSLTQPNVFTVNASEIESKSWSVSNCIPIFYEKPFNTNYLKLGEIAEVTGGASTSSSQYRLDVGSAEYSPYIRISDIINGKISTKNTKFVNDKIIKNVDKYRIKEGAQ